MNLAVVGEDEQIGPRDAKQVPEMLDQWRQCRLKTRGVEFVQPPGAVASFERVGVGSTQLREVARPTEIVHRQPHVEGEIRISWREIHWPDKRAAAQPSLVIDGHFPSVESAVVSEVR